MRLFPMKFSKPAVPKQRLQATAARRASRASSLEEDEEPTTSFKTALVVVVLLHLVAAGGIYMFDSIKTHRVTVQETPAPAAVQKVAAPAVRNSAPVAAATPVAPAHAKPAVAAVPETPKKPAPPAVAEVKDSGNLYTVGKGENPVAIARKLHVSYDDLLKLNQIEDPKKLRIGQKLHIPVKPRAAAN